MSWWTVSMSSRVKLGNTAVEETDFHATLQASSVLEVPASLLLALRVIAVQTPRLPSCVTRVHIARRAPLRNCLAPKGSPPSRSAHTLPPHSPLLPLTFASPPPPPPAPITTDTFFYHCLSSTLLHKGSSVRHQRVKSFVPRAHSALLEVCCLLV